MLYGQLRFTEEKPEAYHIGDPMIIILILSANV